MNQNIRTSVEISLPNILHNIRELKKLLASKTKFMAVVKADAYGHGAVDVCKAIEGEVDYLSVATLSEALEIKKTGIEKPILILSEIHPSDAEHVVKNGLIQTVYTPDLARTLSAKAKKIGKNSKVHLKIDTGMGRIGVPYKSAIEFYEQISKFPGIDIEGVFTHLAKAEENNGFTAEQLKRFSSFVSKIKTDHLLLHAANSAGALYHRESHLDMVRIGLAMYGLNPPGGNSPHIKLKPALEFKTRVVYLKKVPAGTPLSYGSTYITQKETNIVTLPVGYADGLPRALSNKGQVLIGGKRYPIVGRVCMDLTLIEVGDETCLPAGRGCEVGDEVILIGKQGNENISADDVARIADTINYEIVCGIGKRVPRVYIKA